MEQDNDVSYFLNLYSAAHGSDHFSTAPKAITQRIVKDFEKGENDVGRDPLKPVAPTEEGRALHNAEGKFNVSSWGHSGPNSRNIENMQV